MQEKHSGHKAQRLTSGTDRVEWHPRVCHQDSQSNLLEDDSEAGDRLPGQAIGGGCM